jgi:threonyl-tRNA synthetase
MMVCGDKEVESGKIALRHHGDGDLGAISVSEAIDRLTAEIQSRALPSKMLS